MVKSILDNIIETFYDKTKRIILIFFILGLILRIIAANNVGVSADDVNHAVRPIGIFSSEKLVIFDQSTILWYYIQGVVYNIFGATQFISRFAETIFGSLTIILMFLFVKKVFKSEKAAIISSFLIAISPMLIKSTLPEMDVAVGFFLILSAFFLFSYFESRKNKDLMLSALFIGIGTMIKLYSLFFAFSFIIFYIFKEIKSSPKKTIIKNVFLFGLILFVLVIPTLAHNYLLYKDKGFMDLLFTNNLKLGVEKAKEFYSWGAGWMPYSDYNGFFFGNQRNFDPTPLPGCLVVLGFLLKGDPILFILGILGLILVFKKKRDYFWFFIITFVPAFIILGAQIPMSKHFIWGLALLAPAAGFLVDKIHSKLNKIKLRYFLLAMLIFSIFYLGMPKEIDNGNFYAKSSFNQLMSYKDFNIPKNALIVADSRIYRGNIHWALNDRNYIEAAYFFDAVKKVNELGNLKNIEVYYVECVIDDCGWGTVKDQPDFNASMEQITEFFANNSYSKKDFESADPYSYYFPLFKEQKRTDYRIYKTEMALNPIILDVVKQTHSWFLYPIGYDRSISEIFDDYQTHNAFDSSINTIAWMILYTELIITFLSIIYLAYIFINENETINNNPIL
jgi:hypothetical protein